MTASDIDYEGLGFKCGIEIHQQVDSSTKLFCSCRNEQVDAEPVAKIRRRLRPVASELGEVDRAARFEHVKGKDFVYNIYPGVSCLVELDEEPPHPVNREALDVGLTMALLLDCTVPDEIHFMRKTVIDGSNTAGFQRTAIIGLDGELETSRGPVTIEDLELEEESAGIHSRDEGKGVFDLDRLGIPLIEIGTDASLEDPEHAREVAEKLGMLLRSTGTVKRGLGTIRQDVNISIAGGARVEVKGFQNIETLDILVENEVRRQKTLLELMDEVPDDVTGEVQDVTGLFEDADNDIIRRVVESDGAVVAFTLHGLEGLMDTALCEGLTLGKELANYARAAGVAGMMHTDEDLERYGLADEFDVVCSELGKTEGDVVCIIADAAENAENAAAQVVERAEKLPDAVPEETRIPFKEAATRYARPLPGRARMYPETDIPPIVVDSDHLQRIDDELPETLEEKEERYTAEIGEELGRQIVHSPHLHLFEAIIAEENLDPKAVANLLLNTLGGLKARDAADADAIRDHHLKRVATLLAEDAIPQGAVEDLLQDVAANPEADVRVLAQDYESMDEDAIRDVVQAVLEEKQELIEEQGEHARGALMGLIMQRVENADGATVNRILDEELETVLD